MTPSSSSCFFSKTFYGFTKWVYYSWILTTFFKRCCIHTIWTFAWKQFSKNLIEYNRCHPNSSKNNTEIWSRLCSLLHYRKTKPGTFLLIIKSTFSFTYNQYILCFDHPKPHTVKSVYVGHLLFHLKPPNLWKPLDTMRIKMCLITLANVQVRIQRQVVRLESMYITLSIKKGITVQYWVSCH